MTEVNIGSKVMVLNLMEAHLPQWQVVMDLVKTLLFLVLTIFHLSRLLIKKTISLILIKYPTNGLDDTTITAETEYAIHFTKSKEILFCLSLHYNGSDSFVLVMM